MKVGRANDLGLMQLALGVGFLVQYCGSEVSCCLK